jgi:fibronectin type III domain protein
MMGHEQPRRSRSRRLSRRASIAFAVVVVVAFVVGGAVPAFADPPVAPAQPTVLGLDSAILVTFVPLSDPSVLSYTATCTSFDGGAPGTAVGGTSPIIVGGLTNGSSYTCTVFASNGPSPGGDGPPSPASDVGIPSGKPDAPPAPTVLPLSASILVTFETPFDGGSPINGYAASCTSLDGGVDGSGTGQTSPIAVGPLSNGKHYTCTVQASNNNGFGPDSPASQPAVPNTVPDTPDAPSVISLLDGSISVSFTAPFDGGSPIVNYTAVCTSPDDSTQRIGTNAASPIAVTGAIPGKTYTCTLVASNADGPSGTSPPSTQVTPGGKPDAPLAPTVAAGNASISVAFAAPPSNGSPITGYTADCKSSNGGVERTVGGVGVVTSPIVVTGLTNGRTYTCNVTATNLFGAGPSSSASGPAVPKTVPAQPGAPTVVAGNALLTVGFHAPYNGGFAITKYRVYCASTNGGVARTLFVTSLQAVVTGVTNGASYRCNVTAYSVVGASPASLPSGFVIPGTAHGFRMFTGDGGVFVFGDSPYYGAAHSPVPVIAMMTTPDNHGYWLVANNGAVYAFGNARSYGSLAGRHLNRPIVGGTATRTGRGYWLVASDGGIFAFGDATFYGSTGNIRLAQPIVGMTPTATGRGYWFVAQDGGLFAFGDAHFYGSAAASHERIIGMATAWGGTGYWIAAYDGTVFAFGSAGIARGRIGGLVYPITGIASTDTGRGFWTTAANGAVTVMGDAPFIPWPRAIRLATYIRGISR